MQPRSEKSLQAERAFYDLVTGRGGTVLEDRWLGANQRHRVRCAAGHETTPLPATVRKTNAFCRVCSGKDPGAAWERFKARVEELGGVVVEERWLGVMKPHRVRCKDGHEVAPYASGVLSGGGLCRICANLDPDTAEEKFREHMGRIGAVLLEEKWLGGGKPHRVICPAGHETTVRPSSIARHAGFCRTCGGNDPKVAEREFRERVEALGGTVPEQPWRGMLVAHRIRCANGHEGSIRPANVRLRGTICRTCARRDPRLAEKEFRERLAELGVVLIEGKWLGANEPHPARCAQGHDCAPRPGHLRSGRGACLACARKDPVRAEAEFRARVAELGGEVLEPEWRGANEPHKVRCAEGHVSSPRPTGVQQGNGICRHCMGKLWDAFYVVVNDAEDILKFGITSGDPKPRLKRHAANGFERVVRVIAGLPMGTAHPLESAVKATLKLARMHPVRGTEFFPVSALATVLDIVDHYPIRPKPVVPHIPVQMMLNLDDA